MIKKDSLTIDEMITGYLEPILFSVNENLTLHKYMQKIDYYNYTLKCSDKEFMDIVKEIEKDGKFKKFYYNKLTKELLFFRGDYDYEQN